MTIIIGAALLLITGLLFGLYFVGGADTPEVRLADVGPVTVDSGPPAGEPAARVEITPDNVQNVIATLRRLETYSRTILQTRYWDGGTASGTTTAEIWVTPEALRIQWDHGENMILTAERYYLWFGRGRPITRPITDVFGESLDQILDEFQGVPSYETVLGLDQGDILAAGYIRRQVAGEYVYCIYVTVQGPGDSVDHFYIALDTGLLVEMRTYHGDTLIYRMETTALLPVPPEGAVFYLPDGTGVLA